MKMTAPQIIELLQQIKAKLPEGAQDEVNRDLHSKIGTYILNSDCNTFVTTYRCDISDVLPHLVCIDNNKVDVDLEYGAIISNVIQDKYKSFKDGMTLEASFDSKVRQNKKGALTPYNHKSTIEVIYKIDNDNYILKATYKMTKI